MSACVLLSAQILLAKPETHAEPQRLPRPKFPERGRHLAAFLSGHRV